MRTDQILNPISLSDRWPFSSPHLPTSDFPPLTPRSKKGKNNIYAIPDIFTLNMKGNRVLSTYHLHENISFFSKRLVSTRGEKNVRERLMANDQNGTGVRLRRSSLYPQSVSFENWRTNSFLQVSRTQCRSPVRLYAHFHPSRYALAAITGRKCL